MLVAQIPMSNTPHEQHRKETCWHKKWVSLHLEKKVSFYCIKLSSVCSWATRALERLAGVNYIYLFPFSCTDVNLLGFYGATEIASRNETLETSGILTLQHIPGNFIEHLMFFSLSPHIFQYSGERNCSMNSLVWILCIEIATDNVVQTIKHLLQ